MTKSNPQGGVTKPRSGTRRNSPLSTKCNLLLIADARAPKHDRPPRPATEQAKPTIQQDVGNRPSQYVMDAMTRPVQMLPPRWHSRSFEPRNRADRAGSLTRPCPTCRVASRGAERESMDRFEYAGPVLSKADIEAMQRNAVAFFRAFAWRKQAVTFAMLQAYLSRTPNRLRTLLVEPKDSTPCTTRQLRWHCRKASDLDLSGTLHRHCHGSPLIFMEWCAKTMPDLVKVDNSSMERRGPEGSRKCVGCKRACARKRDDS